MLWWIVARCLNKDLASVSCKALLPTPQDFLKMVCCVPPCFWVLWPTLFFGVFSVRSQFYVQEVVGTSLACMACAIPSIDDQIVMYQSYRLFEDHPGWHSQWWPSTQQWVLMTEAPDTWIYMLCHCMPMYAMLGLGRAMTHDPYPWPTRCPRSLFHNSDGSGGLRFEWRWPDQDCALFTVRALSRAVPKLEQ